MNDSNHLDICKRLDLHVLANADKGEHTYTVERMCICAELREAAGIQIDEDDWQKGYDLGHSEGYEAAYREMSWNCLDCGNTYGPDVHECPNRGLDEIAVTNRYRKARDGG